jgi:peroxiredoxin family protein
MADIKELEAQVAALKADVDVLKANAPEDKLSMVVMSGDMDKLLASFIIATGAAAMFEKVVMFFTFWSIPALKDPKKTVSKDTVSKMFELMLPNGAGGTKLSKMHMGGMGKLMIESIMKKHNVMSLGQLMKTAADSGVQIYVCQMSMDLMGYKMEEMVDYPNLKSAGVGKFLAEAGTSKSSLFI